MKTCRCQKIYFVVCLFFIIGLSSIRSPFVYGKLDFILLDGRPWWKPWRPMIEEVLQAGEQPILTDFITSTVLRAVFAQKAVSFRYAHYLAQIDVEELSSLNIEQRRLVPLGVLFLLLDDELYSTSDKQAGEENRLIKEIMLDVATAAAEKPGKEEKEYLYRCLINLHGFIPSWVPTETGHWPLQWAEPSLLYEFKGVRGEEMKQLLRDDPPGNCPVYF